MVKAEDFLGRDIIFIEDLSRADIDLVLKKTDEFFYDFNGAKRYRSSLIDKVMVSAFFEPSSRTAVSFQMAMHRQGGAVIPLDEDKSSRKKGETLRDTAKTIAGYSPDVVVIRHKKDGSAQLFADEFDCPVINAGDGKNQHPTQTLVDLYTISKLTLIPNLRIAIVGDLKYGRTTHSLVSALNMYEGCSVKCISPEQLRMPKNLISKSSNINIEELGLEALASSLHDVDVVYMTRIQRERFAEGVDGEQEYNKIKSQYSLKLSMLEKVNPHLKIMHPLPKVDEIESAIDETSFAHYYEQASNGLYVRCTLLNLVCGGKLWTTE